MCHDNYNNVVVMHVSIITHAHPIPRLIFVTTFYVDDISPSGKSYRRILLWCSLPYFCFSAVKVIVIARGEDLASI